MLSFYMGKNTLFKKGVYFLVLNFHFTRNNDLKKDSIKLYYIGLSSTQSLMIYIMKTNKFSPKSKQWQK